MERYVGTKIINAKPMNRLEYNKFRGWTLPEDENGSDEGMLVEYVDGGKANTDKYKGYVSWSPLGVFNKAYKSSGELSFGSAIEFLKLGYKVARKGWNGKGMYIYLKDAGTKENPHDGSICTRDPYIIMKTASNSLQAGWLASQADMLAEDWEIIE